MLTKRIVLSQVNGIYDPMGLSCPFTTKAKVLLQMMWMGKLRGLNWDDPLPDEVKDEWIQFFQEMFHMEDIEFCRCIQPDGSVGNPILVIFSDGSEAAYGAVAYIRWETKDGSYKSALLSAKARIAPLKKVTIVRLELSAAVLSKILRVFIEKECRLKFERVYHIVDSKIVRAMIQGESQGFQTYAAVRISEIQEKTDKGEWYWVEGKSNIADQLTRGRRPNELGRGSEWQNGPAFLQYSENDWPIKGICNIEDSQLPERVKIHCADVDILVDSLAIRIQISRFSRFTKLIRVTARVLSMYKYLPNPSFKNAVLSITKLQLVDAEYFWVKDAQKDITDAELEKRYNRLSPKRKHDGVIIVGQRREKWMGMNYNGEELMLLSYSHPFSKLYAEHIHKQDHLGGGGGGVSATTSK